MQLFASLFLFQAKRIGIFSCGPPSMTTSVEKACGLLNRESDKRFEHHFKNF